MKGFISGIKRMEIHDGDGLRTTVFLKGCPLKCIWCHNPESISFRRQVAFFSEKCIHCGFCSQECNEKTAQNCPADAQILYGQDYEPEELFEILRQDEAYFRNSGGGITISGGECLAQPQFTTELAKLLFEHGISVYIDTCGFVPQTALEQILPYTDLFLYDLKAIDSQVHRRCTGQDNKIILQNLAWLSGQGCRIEIRYPLVMGYNDGECEKIGAFLQDLSGITRIKVLQYHNFAGSRYEALHMENTLPRTKTSPEDVAHAVETLKDFGLPAVNGLTES